MVKSRLDSLGGIAMIKFPLSDSDFNRFITTILLIYCMLMFSLSWLYGRPLDLSGFLILVAPLLSQVIHNVASANTNNGVTK